MELYFLTEFRAQGAHVRARCHMLQAAGKHVYVESGDARPAPRSRRHGTGARRALLFWDVDSCEVLLELFAFPESK